MNVILDAFERALYTRQPSSSTSHHHAAPAAFFVPVQRARRRSMTLNTSPIHIVSTQQQRRPRPLRHPTTTSARRMSFNPPVSTQLQLTYSNPVSASAISRGNTLTVGGNESALSRKYSDGGIVLAGGGHSSGLEVGAATAPTARRASFNPLPSTSADANQHESPEAQPRRRKTSAVGALLAGVDEPSSFNCPSPSTRRRPSNSLVGEEPRGERHQHRREMATTPPSPRMRSPSPSPRCVSPATTAVAIAQRIYGNRNNNNNNKPPFHRQLAYCMANGMQQFGAMKSEEVIEVLSSPRMTSGLVGDEQQAGSAFSSRAQLPPRTVLLGFVRSLAHHSANAGESPTSSASSSRRSSAALFRGGEKDHGLDRALAECNTIRSRRGSTAAAVGELDQGLLLRCMDRGALYPFMHYTIYRAGGGADEGLAGGGHAPGTVRGARLKQLIAELRVSSALSSDFAPYEELYAIQKSVSSAPSAGGGDSALLSSGRHSGYIVSFFKLLDQSYRQVELERTWLSWTGAREIYKYSPRNWNLRRITLHKHHHDSGASSSSSFAYVLICEFNNILHPSNMLQAMDMCERLRARNCGYIALYQVQYGYGGEQAPGFEGMGATVRSNSTATPPKPPPLHTNSTWSPPIAQKVLPAPPIPPPPKDPSPLAAAVRRRELLRGYSQDVDSTHETLRRRSAMLRMRDRSLGYDQQPPGASAHGNESRRGSTADGGVVMGPHYSSLHMANPFYPGYGVGVPLHSSSGSLPQSSTPPEMRSAREYSRPVREFTPPPPPPLSNTAYYQRAMAPNYPGSSNIGHGGGASGPVMDYYE